MVCLAVGGIWSLFSAHTLPQFPKRLQQRLLIVIFSPAESILPPIAPLRAMDEALRVCFEEALIRSV